MRTTNRRRRPMRGPAVRLVRHTVRKPGRQPATYWELRWPDSRGKTRCESVGRADQVTLREAGDRRREKQTALDTRHAPRDPTQMTVEEFLELDRAAITTRVKRSTVDDHRTKSRRLLAAIDPTMRLNRVGWRQVSALMSWLDREHKLGGRQRPRCSRATIAGTVATLKAAWNRAIRRDLVGANPFAGEKLPKVQPKQKRIFSLEELEAMVEVAPMWWVGLLRLGITTGLRLGEMLALTWEDVDEDRGQVVVSAKRASAHRLEWSAKSHHERRVPLCPETIEALGPLRLRGGGSPYVFIDRQRLEVLLRHQEQGRLPQTAQWVNNLPRDFRALQVGTPDNNVNGEASDADAPSSGYEPKDLGTVQPPASAREALARRRGVEPERLEWRVGTLHDLRKSYGTHMARAGVPTHELRRLMGHASITTTADFYLDASEDLRAKVRAVFGRAAG